MCGRFTLIRLADFLDEFPWILPPVEVPPAAGDHRYNIAPTQPVAAVIGGTSPHVEFVQWGLVPSWAKDAGGGGKLINARAETLAERPAFRRLLAGRRCLVPADGFYEWKPEGRGRKTPYYLRLRSGRPFALAGLWDVWRDPSTGRSLTSCTIITGEPNATVAALHHRMAVILRADDYRRWLSPDALSDADRSELFAPYPAEAMEAHPVSSAVNSARSGGPGLVERAEPSTAPIDPQPLLF
jgi:putative SOS response-associated peptidase YedK